MTLASGLVPVSAVVSEPHTCPSPLNCPYTHFLLGTFPVRHRGGRPWWKSGRWGERGSYLFPFMGTCTSADSKSGGDWGWLQLAWGSAALRMVSGALPPGLSEQGQRSPRGHCGLVSRGSAAVGGMWATAQCGSALALICHRVFVLRLHLCPLSLSLFKRLPHLYN